MDVDLLLAIWNGVEMDVDFVAWISTLVLFAMLYQPEAFELGED